MSKIKQTIVLRKLATDYRNDLEIVYVGSDGVTIERIERLSAPCTANEMKQALAYLKRLGTVTVVASNKREYTGKVMGANASGDTTVYLSAGRTCRNTPAKSWSAPPLEPKWDSVVLAIKGAPNNEIDL